MSEHSKGPDGQDDLPEDQTPPLSPFDDQEDLTPEPEPKKEPFVSGWDAVILLVLVLAGAGFWYWYSGMRDTSKSHFHVADSLYVAGKYQESLVAYQALRSNESIIAKQDDSLMYLRMDTLEAYEEKDLQLANGARAAIASEDTSLIRSAADMVRIRNHGFVPRSLLDSLHL